ncbi:Tetratricopeptide repeat-containing protein [Loktanella atrilutea]|uniref:Tetratricopeptide repeat-containing protein n=1 Tax=Loktanella atrilutea TaxID=366533 RepID=A0A1M5A2A9_LOKAT|nr:tetratricopeptide repeat protein [Loktanella atrilutea]SHF24510.1 Tetratricopeptide repeat-containing protein [Loktanella atrilutea]
MILRPLLVACLALAPLAGTAQQPSAAAATLSPDQMRGLALDLLDRGQPAEATGLLDALLQRDPDDVAALILGARAAFDRDDPAEAQRLAARAYGRAPDDTTRYVAARLAARAQAAQGHDTRAQFWLRRARQYAPDAAEAESVAQDYAFLRDRNPLSVDLSFGISPSNNINNGTQSDEVVIGGIAFLNNNSAKPLAGIQYDAGATLTYRLDASDRSATFAELALRTTQYTLAGSARDALQEDIDSAAARGFATDDLPRNGHDFAYTAATVTLLNRTIHRAGWLPTTYSMGLGTSWYGGNHYQTTLDLGVSHAVAMGPRARLQFSGGLRQDFADERSGAFGTPPPARASVLSRDALSYTAGLGYVRIRDDGDRLSLSVSDRVSRSDDTERDYNALQIGVGYDLAQPIMNVGFGFGVQLEQRRFENSFFVDGIRRDYTVTAQVTALLENVEYYGFQPAVTVGLGRTFSDSARFDTRYGTVGLDVRSAF